MTGSEDKYKIVMFNDFCPKCKYEDTDENAEPCETCISEFVKVASRKPVKFEEKE